MMKRLVVLLLVFALTSAANALLLEVDGVPTSTVELVQGTTSVITIVGEDASSWLGYIIVEEGGTGALSNIVALDAAGDLAAASPYQEAGWGAGYEINTGMSPSSSMPISTGPQFNVDYSGGELGQTAKISLFIDPEYTTPVASVNVSIVPEPMTIALLGLGALFLRKRK
ncbi:MAG: PEP-CTERM sorting domain-containing protein [Sedimentisphaerales bacterium]|nr:PEP-CTERM sorting domain-containing protein [Sedimentisphaerales bacterium]